MGPQRHTEPGWTPEREAAGRALVAPVARLRHALEWQLPVRGERVDRWLLNGLVEMLGADLAFTCRGHDGDRWELEAYSYIADHAELEHLAGTALARLGDLVRGGGEPAAGWRATAPDGVETMAVRLTPGRGGTWLFVVGDSLPAAARGEPAGVVCRAVIDSHAGGREAAPVRAQAAAWDALLRHLGTVPAEMYEARLAVFTEQLRGLVPMFAPVLYLDRDRPGIDGWQAVAHRGRGNAHELYAAADLWGPEFRRLLDRRMLHAAVRDYLAQVNDAPAHTGQGLPLPRGLTVGVHASTLLAPDAPEHLEELLHGGSGMRGAELALEISGLCAPMGADGPAVSARLTEIHDRLGIGVVVDGLRTRQEIAQGPDAPEPTYVKLDAWITSQPDAGLVTSLVEAALAAPWAGPERLVVTAFADQPPFQLEDAFALGVRLLQGEFVGQPSRELRLEPGPDQLARVMRAADRVRLRRPSGASAAVHGRGPGPRVPGFGRHD